MTGRPPETDRPALLGGAPLRPAGPPAWPRADDAVRQRLRELGETGDWGRYHGPWCERLIVTLRERFDCRHVILCSSGTAAVELALRAAPVNPQTRVALAAYDFKANFTNVHTVGATPVLFDIRADDWQLDVGRVIDPSADPVQIVLASHLHGSLVELPSLCDWAEERGVFVIEDACQAAGAMLAGRPAGTWGDVGVLSFGGSKLLTSGRGGALLTNRDDVAQRIRLYTQRGNEAYPLSEMQAAVLLPQLGSLAARHRQRAAAVQWLRAALSGSGLEPLATSSASDEPAYYKLGLRYVAAAFGGLTRERFAEAMRAEGIALDPGLRALHRIHARSRYVAAGPLDVAAVADAEVLTLHHPVLLESEADWAQIPAAVERIRRWATALATDS